MATDLTRYQEHVEDFFEPLPNEAFEKAPCIFCGPECWKIHLFSKGSMEVYRCRCGFVWNARQPTQEVLSKFYLDSQAMSDWAEIKKTESEDKRQREKYSRAVDFLINSKIRSILDVGCGTGKFLSLLKETSLPVDELGIDTNDAALAVAKEAGVNVQNATLEAITDQYDAISLWGVLEHVKNPRAFLDQCIDRLHPGGYLIIAVPNVQSSVVTALWSECFTFTPQHLWYFGPETLNRLTEHLGLYSLEQYTIEPEEHPVAKRFLGLKPYEPWPKVTSFDFARVLRSARASITKTDSGYKIVKILQKLDLSKS